MDPQTPFYGTDFGPNFPVSFPLLVRHHQLAELFCIKAADLFAPCCEVQGHRQGCDRVKNLGSPWQIPGRNGAVILD